MCFAVGFFSHVLLPQKTQNFASIKNYTKTPKTYGDSAQLRHIHPGSLINNLSLTFKGVGIIARAAGVSALLIRRQSGAAILKLKSGELRAVRTFAQPR